MPVPMHAPVEPWRVAVSAAAALCVLAVAVPPRARRAALVVGLAGAALAAAWGTWRRRSDEGGVAHAAAGAAAGAGSAKEEPASGSDDDGRRAFDPELYTLRRARASPGAPHTALRPGVARALAALQGGRFGTAGHAERAAAAVEDFFVRYDRALLADDGGGLAARTLPVLMDTRRAALNALVALELAAPQALVGDVRRARAAVRRGTQAAVAVLARKYRRAPGVRAVEWRPPYALDPRASAHELVV